jgi:hypothetical protein
MNDRHFENEVLRLLHDDHKRIVEIEKLLKFPHLTLYQVGDTMAIGTIVAGQSGQFAVAVNFPAGITAPAGYVPLITPSSSDPLVTFAPATTDLSNGAVPLSQQFVATVAASDTNTSAQIGATALGTDGVTVLTANVLTVAITPVTVPPTEPTLVLSQVG